MQMFGRFGTILFIDEIDDEGTVFPVHSSIL